MINAELLNQAGISHEEGMSRFMNDAELYEAVLQAFIEEDILERAAAAYAAKDKALLQDIIHEAKGSGGNAGLEKLYNEASALVLLLRSSSYRQDELEEHYNRFVKAYTTVKEGIKAALGK